MRITTFRGETSVTDLVNRLYSDLDAAKRAKAEAALLKANPQLRGLDSLAPGAVLAVPSVSGVRVKASRDIEYPVEEVADTLASDLKDYGRHLAARHELHEQRLKEQTALLKDKELKKALRTRPEGEPLLKQIAQATKVRLEEVKNERKGLEEALKQMSKKLGKL